MAGAGRFRAGRPSRYAALIAIRNSRCRPAWHSNGSVTIDSNGQLCPCQEIQGAGQGIRILKRENFEGIVMIAAGSYTFGSDSDLGAFLCVLEVES